MLAQVDGDMPAERDYDHIIWEIRCRLDRRKAAVVVGAGFSRNAKHRSDTRKSLPDWKEFTNRLAQKLYPDLAERDKVLAQAGATSAALRLAQEFEIAFGRVALVEFVREALPDEEFVPGALHRGLLELPWSDVFTTNYDRLLEISARSLWNQHYEVVQSIHDLPIARQPRIVKLHGTLPNLDNLVVTEEDYRCYPQTFAPFVTTVQAALTQNILCLIGFSGDDPNFLAWTGWLRDEMRSAVPNTYFFTGSELKPFQRQLLEERRIVPIPLKLIAKADNWDRAYQWLFEQLAIPPGPVQPAWNVGPRHTRSWADPNLAKEPAVPGNKTWVDTAILWRRHRLLFKGWHVLDRKGIEKLDHYTEQWFNLSMTLNATELPEPTVLFVLRELVWRWVTSLRPLPDQFVFELLDPQMDRFAGWHSLAKDRNVTVKGSTDEIVVELGELSEAYQMLLQECLRHAREINDDERFEALLTKLKGMNTFGTSTIDAQSFLNYQQILLALARLRHTRARQLLESWGPSTGDPIWAIRRAALFLECAMLPVGKRLLEGTLERLRSVPASSELNIPSMSAEGILLSLLLVIHSVRRFAPNPVQDLEKQEPSPNGIVGSGDLPSQAERTNQVVKSPPPSVQAAGNSKAAATEEDRLERSMLDRLNELSVFGCDPTDFQDWLEEITAPEPHRTQGSFEVDGFDIGNVSRKHKGGDELQLKAAYRAIRFIEDAGIPLEVPETVTMSVASKLFRQAMKVIAYFAPHEAVGLFLRARNQDLTKEVLSRKCLATLSENRFNTLFDTARNGIYDAFSRLGSTTIPSERDNEYWREQARVACLALDRAVVRIKDELFGALFSRLVNLQRQPATRDWRIGEGLHECVSRVASLLPKASLEELLPTLLTIPVPGSAESGVPQNVSIDWHDPVIVVMNYRWQPDGDAVARCSRQIEDILSRAAVAQGGERAVLCRRCVYLMEAGILSVTQRQKLAASLFAQTDTNGLPKDTGCFDSLVLSFSSREDFDEVAAFRAKYLTSDSDSVWLALRKTNTGVLNLRSDDRRKLNWSRADLTAILVMAERWIIGKTPPTQSAPPHPFAVMFGRAENLGMAFLDWLATLENVVLLNPRANRAHREKANELIVKAEGFGWCVTQTGPTRVLFNYESPAKAISSMRFYLGDRDAFNVRQACDAIVRWYELGKTSGLSVPTSVPQMLWTLLAERRHEYLSLLISTCKGVIERTDQRTCSTFLTAINSTMQQLLVETTYSYPSGEDTLGWRPSADEGAFSMPMKLRIRVACAKLVRTARRAGLCVPFVEQWSAALQSDLFADVRREYEYDH